MRILLFPLLLASTFGVEVTLDSAPAITGNCNPSRVHFTAHITAAAPGKVTYVWQRSDKGASPAQNVEFAKAGPAVVTYDWLLRARTKGWVSLKILSPAPLQSRKAEFNLSCP